MKKIVSFSLFGQDPKYFEGALCNIELCKIIYPEWICRIYYAHNIPEHYKIQLMQYESDDVELIQKEETDYRFFGMFWRFFAIDDIDVDIMICRDTDSRLSYRERKCVDIFCESDKLLHSIRDNPNHAEMMGGMWGMKKNNILPRSMQDLSSSYHNHNHYGADQIFIRKEIEPLFKDKYMIHCSTFLRTFPEIPDRSNAHFVGEVFPDNNYCQPRNHIFY